LKIAAFQIVAATLLALWLPGVGVGGRAQARTEMVDTALVLAVDVSGSVTPERFALQMEGIARTFEDPAIETAILNGPYRAIFVTLVEWSNRPVVSVPWMLVRSAAEARAFADRIRHAPRADDQFTCMGTALRLIAEKILPFLPAPSQRTIIDVSGDGRENCNPLVPVDRVRDELTAAGITINGLPILEGEEAETLAPWYRYHVIGGPGAFLLPALGFDDFGRAMRSKFLFEISAAPAPGASSGAAD
jgi:hypothetical protein